MHIIISLLEVTSYIQFSGFLKIFLYEQLFLRSDLDSKLYTL